MANNVIQDYSMNVNLGNYQILNAVQGEVNTRYVQVSFSNDNTPYNLTGLFTTINMIKSDGTVIFDNGTIIDATNGIASFPITSEMCTIAGTFDLFFKVYGSNPTSELKITGFQLIVEPANNDAGIISSNEFNALQTLIANVQPALENINTAITNVNTSITNCNNATIAANTASDFANKYGTQAKNVPYVGTDGYWYAWNSTTEKYEKTTAYANVSYATFDIDNAGNLVMNTLANYTGANFALTNDGNLEVII